MSFRNKSAGNEASMLIPYRRPGETLIIETPAGEQATVTVLEVKGNQLRIGTAVPPNLAQCVLPSILYQRR